MRAAAPRVSGLRPAQIVFRHASRNETIASLLAKSPIPVDIGGLDTQRSTLMDRRGEGVSIILERSERLSGKRPVYELLDESELKLTIFAAALDINGGGSRDAQDRARQGERQILA